MSDYTDDELEFGMPVATSEAEPAQASDETPHRPFLSVVGGKRRRGRPKGSSKPQDKEPALELMYAQALYGDGVRFADGQFWRWVGTHWQGQTEEDAQPDALSWLCSRSPDQATANRALGCIKTAQIHLRGKAPLADPPKRAPNEVVVPLLDGTLVVTPTSITLREPDPADGLRYVLPFEFDPEARAPLWTRFLARVQPDADVRKVLQQYAGYTLIQDTRLQLFLLLYGGGSNGKSVAMNTFARLHSPDRVVSLAPESLDGFGVAPLLTASLVQVDELPQKVNEQKVKTAISGGLMYLDRKYLAPVHFRPTAKWIVGANQVPKVRDNSDGFWRRCLVVPFPVTIPEDERDPLLEDRLETEMPGILLWALQGLMQILATGKIHKAAAVERATSAAKHQTNSVLAWFSARQDEDSIVVCPFDEVEEQKARLATRSEVYADYRRFCESSGNAPFSDARFWDALTLIDRDAAERAGRRSDRGSMVRLSRIILAREGF